MAVIKYWRGNAMAAYLDLIIWPLNYLKLGLVFGLWHEPYYLGNTNGGMAVDVAGAADKTDAV